MLAHELLGHAGWEWLHGRPVYDHRLRIFGGGYVRMDPGYFPWRHSIFDGLEGMGAQLLVVGVALLVLRRLRQPSAASLAVLCLVGANLFSVFLYFVVGVGVPYGDGATLHEGLGPGLARLVAALALGVMVPVTYGLGRCAGRELGPGRLAVVALSVLAVLTLLALERALDPRDPAEEVIDRLVLPMLLHASAAALLGGAMVLGVRSVHADPVDDVSRREVIGALLAAGCLTAVSFGLRTPWYEVTDREALEGRVMEFEILRGSKDPATLWLTYDPELAAVVGRHDYDDRQIGFTAIPGPPELAPVLELERLVFLDRGSWAENSHPRTRGGELELDSYYQSARVHFTSRDRATRGQIRRGIGGSGNRIRIHDSIAPLESTLDALRHDGPFFTTQSIEGVIEFETQSQGAGAGRLRIARKPKKSWVSETVGVYEVAGGTLYWQGFAAATQIVITQAKLVGSTVEDPRPIAGSVEFSFSGKSVEIELVWRDPLPPEAALLVPHPWSGTGQLLRSTAEPAQGESLLEDVQRAFRR